MWLVVYKRFEWLTRLEVRRINTIHLPYINTMSVEKVMYFPDSFFLLIPKSHQCYDPHSELWLAMQVSYPK